MRHWPSIQKHKASNKRSPALSMGLSLGWRSPGPHNLMSMGASHNDRWMLKGFLKEFLKEKDEARRIAVNFAKLQDLLRGD